MIINSRSKFSKFDNPVISAINTTFEYMKRPAKDLFSQPYLFKINEQSAEAPAALTTVVTNHVLFICVTPEGNAKKPS